MLQSRNIILNRYINNNNNKKIIKIKGIRKVELAWLIVIGTGF